MSEFSTEQLSKISSRLGKELEEWLRDHTVERHYSAEEVAELLCVTARTVWNYVDQGARSSGEEGIYPVVKLSHKVVRIPASSLNRFLKSRTVTVGGQLQEASA